MVIYNSFQTAHLGHSTVGNKAHTQLPENQQFSNTFWVLIHQILEQVTNKAKISNSEFADTPGHIRFPYPRYLDRELRTFAELRYNLPGYSSHWDITRQEVEIIWLMSIFTGDQNP